MPTLLPSKGVEQDGIVSIQRRMAKIARRRASGAKSRNAVQNSMLRWISRGLFRRGCAPRERLSHDRHAPRCASKKLSQAHTQLNLLTKSYESRSVMV